MYKNVLIVLLFLFGCVSIPKTTYQVSEVIGDGIKANEQSYLNLIDKYFAEKRSAIDMWVVRVYFPRLIDNIKVELKKSDLSTLLSENQYEDIVEATIQKRDEMQLELEKTRVIVVEKVRTNYSELIRANRDLTQLLKSNSELKEELENKVQDVTGVEFDFDKFDKTFTDYLEKADKSVKQGKKLYDKVDDYIEGEK